MSIKENSAFSKSPVLQKLLHQIVLYHIQDTSWSSLTPEQRCSRCILQPQSTGSREEWQCRDTLYFPKLQNWSLAIGLFCVIARIFVGRWGLIPLQRCSWGILQPQPTRLLWLPSNLANEHVTIKVHRRECAHAYAHAYAHVGWSCQKLKFQSLQLISFYLGCRLQNWTSLGWNDSYSTTSTNRKRGKMKILKIRKDGIFRPYFFLFLFFSFFFLCVLICVESNDSKCVDIRL